MRAYIRAQAERHSLEVHSDAARNLIVRRPGSGEGASAPPVIVQAHMDMVCENNADFPHDWSKDAVAATQRDGWLVADNTTLGADNGMGVSLILALLEQPAGFTAPPLEAVFTVEEEGGLDGARGLDVSLLRGRRLLNFDSEEWGYLYIGCAGGGDSLATLPVAREPRPGSLSPLRLSVSGLKGGHSGADIHLDRGNALLLLARAVTELRARLPGLRLADFAGGNLDNAIPREASALLAIEASEAPGAAAAVAEVLLGLRQEFGRAEPDLSLELSAGSGSEATVLTEDAASRLLDLVLTLPYGVLKRSHEIEGLVETSNNVARIRAVQDGAAYEALCLARSSIPSAFDNVRAGIERAARLVGAAVAHDFSFPGWAPNRSQGLLGLTEEVFEEVEGARPEVTAIHAGLECGIIGAKMPGIEMVSFGPDIVGAHAPGERVRLASVASLAVVVERLMGRLARGGVASRAAEL